MYSLIIRWEPYLDMPGSCKYTVNVVGLCSLPTLKSAPGGVELMLILSITLLIWRLTGSECRFDARCNPAIVFLKSGLVCNTIITLYYNMYLTIMSTLYTVIHDCRHQVTSSEAVVQRLLEEDAFKQKRYNHPLGYIINMILTYFCGKVKFLSGELP